MSPVRFAHFYLKNRMQRIKINSEYSSWKETIHHTPQEIKLRK